MIGRLRHVAYAAGWKKFEPFWDVVIRLKQTARMLPLLEALLDDAAESGATGERPLPASRAAAGGRAVPAANEPGD